VRVKFFARHSINGCHCFNASSSMAHRSAGTPAECNVYRIASHTRAHSSGVLCAPGRKTVSPLTG